MSSSSTTEPRRPAAVEPGTRIAGFRVEAPLHSTPYAISYEATQLSLQRRVTLVLYDDAVAAHRAAEAARRQALLHHPSIVAVFETGASDHGLFVARRSVTGTSLGRALAAGTLDAARARRCLDAVEQALAAAHEHGLVHGDLSAGTVLIEGDRGVLAELRVPADFEIAVAADRAALAALRARCARELRDGSPARSRRRPALIALAGAAVAIAGTAAVLRISGEDRSAPVAPAVTPGALVLGASLAAPDRVTRGCDGQRPSGSALGCTLVQVDPRGRPLAAPADGVIRAWAVRGAAGTLAVQVVRRARDGTSTEVARSQYEAVGGAETVRFASDVPVRAGDLLALELRPGSGVGVAAAAGATMLQWSGALELARPPRRPDARAALAGTLLVRYELLPGVRRREPRQLQGADARRAPAGTVLGTTTLELAGEVLDVSAVRAGRRLVVDLSGPEGRRARVEVPEADARGRLDVIEQGTTSRRLVRLTWRQPGGAPPVFHTYRVGTRGLTLVL